MLEWKKRKGRKVMVVRGARQVGKTYSIRALGSTFPNFLEVNFEETREVRDFFSGNLDPAGIIERLAIYYSIPVREGETLLFFDEIQACPDALRSLRFFHEKMPGLHVIAAGSLLEFALSEIASYGVGRIEYSYLYPLSFLEFLDASGKQGLRETVKSAGYDRPVDPVFHKNLLDLLKMYLVTGGMPESVATYMKTNDPLVSQKVLDDLLTTLYDDFAKYRGRLPAGKLSEVFQSIMFQAGLKFKYSKISEERSSTYKNCLDLLVRAGLAYRIYHTSARGLPLGAQINDRKFKVLPFDAGIYQRISGLNLSRFMVADYDELINRGSIAEILVFLEMVAGHPAHLKPEIFYWHREARAGNAEIDYLVTINKKIIPIEVKAGTKGSMQSLYIFLSERALDCGIRISSENFTHMDRIRTMPLYAAGEVWRIFR
ncbi:MAG: ATP-binding protein [Spirochaetales bacterium]|nr:ATP-binding protein [Spirochaetales bacterium]